MLQVMQFDELRRMTKVRNCDAEIALSEAIIIKSTNMNIFIDHFITSPWFKRDLSCSAIFSFYNSIIFNNLTILPTFNCSPPCSLSKVF